MGVATKKKSTAAKPAAKPKKTKATLLERVASFPIPKDAAGLARPWKGMAVDERAHALLGLGYPKFLVPVDEPVAALPNLATYKKLYEDAIVIPRALAPIRQAIEETEVFSIEEYEKSMRAGKGAPLAKAIELAFKYGFQTLRPLEVIHGATAVAEAAVTHLEALPKIVWSPDEELDEDEAMEIGRAGIESSGYFLFRQLGNMLWRVPVATEKKLRSRLVKLLAKVRKDGEVCFGAQGLAVILEGRAAVERYGNDDNNGNLHLSDLFYATDDPEWVAAMAIPKLATLKPADRAFFDIQLAVVGGPKVLAKLRASTGAFKKDQAKSIADQLSLCA